jgi:hypothetical protein
MQLNRFVGRCLLAFAISLCMTENHFAQRNTSGTESRRESKTVVGILYGSSGGQHIRENVFKTPAGLLVITTEDATRYSGFRRQEAWSLGAQWRVVYR